MAKSWDMYRIAKTNWEESGYEFLSERQKDFWHKLHFLYPFAKTTREGSLDRELNSPGSDDADFNLKDAIQGAINLLTEGGTEGSESVSSDKSIDTRPPRMRPSHRRSEKENLHSNCMCSFNLSPGLKYTIENYVKFLLESSGVIEKNDNLLWGKLMAKHANKMSQLYFKHETKNLAYKILSDALLQQ